MCEKEKQKLIEQVNNLTPIEFSKLCLRVVKKIINKKPVENTIEKRMNRSDIEILAKLMIENNIKIDENNE